MFKTMHHAGGRQFDITVVCPNCCKQWTNSGTFTKRQLADFVDNEKAHTCHGCRVKERKANHAN